MATQTIEKLTLYHPASTVSYQTYENGWYYSEPEAPNGEMDLDRVNAIYG